MKRPLNFLAPVGLAVSLPFLLGAAIPPARPIPQAQTQPVIEVNVIDRFLQDTGIRKRPKPAERSRSRKPSGRNAIPKPPALASVPIPLPKPKPETVGDKTAQEDAAKIENKDVTSQPDNAPAAATSPDASTPAPAPGPAPVAEPPVTENAPAAETPEPEQEQETSDTGKPATSEPESPPPETAKPAAPEPSPDAESPKSEATTPPVVEQPATATEPARQAEVPKPLPKPETEAPSADAADNAKPQDDAKDGETAKDAAKPDGKQEEEGEKAESDPPPPLVKEDPQELQACLADLKAIGAKFETTDPINEGNGCGIENPVDVAEVLPGVDLGGATMRCKTALTMGRWLKQTAQPALDIAMPGRRITGLVPGSTYQCRLRNSASTGKISEHARGNAYDVAAFKLDNGEKIEMKPRAEDSTMEGAFQRTATAGACLHFTTVLSPGSDATHQDHLHLDILERKGGYRYCR